MVWGAAGIVASPYLSELAGGRSSVLEGLVYGPLIGWYGFLAGLVFSGVLAVAARRRQLRELSPRGMGLMGAAASVLLTAPPMVYMLAGRTDGWRSEDLLYRGGSLVLSAACAAGSLMLARRGAGVPAEMLFSAPAPTSLPAASQPPRGARRRATIDRPPRSV
jgi:hypothetical protein